MSESGQSAATYDLQVCGNIDLLNCAARIQSEINNDLGQEIELPPELQRTEVLTAKGNWKSHRYYFKIAMVEQFDMKRRKEDIILEKKLENALEVYIDALYLLEAI